MFKKKLISLGLLSILCFSLTACGNINTKTPDSTNNILSEIEEIQEIEEKEDDFIAEDLTENISDETLDTIFKEVKSKLGDNYFPNMEITPDILEELYGINPDMYDSYYAEIPMISNNVDFLIGVKASEGNLEAVETALNKYVDALKADMMQYPSNLAKIPAATVETFGDYVFAVGTFGDTVEVDEQGDEAILELATEHINTTIDTIKNVMVAE